ncbi:putative membrane protein [Halopenitus persicus]|uniref:Putative membrane protein n=2 Tax=Halopenitus persicus TaxID=1048396 RepID=A0A1H3IKI1_9EURY|nr:putative membrane protein [Halopenitus persicus]
MPVSGWEAVRSLVTEIGLADPEDASVNCILEALRVARELRDGREEAVVAVVSGRTDSRVGADRSIAAQIDELVERYDPDSAIVVVDSAEDERVLPIVESRLPVDSVDRVVVRQAHDLESSYYLLKQFLADEELRSTVLVPVGIGLLVVPSLLFWFSPEVAVAGLTGLLGTALLYKGLAIDEYLADVPDRVREALYAGKVSIVTYVVAAGLSLVGIFLGALSISELPGSQPLVVEAIQLVYAAVPWLAGAALTAATGRLLDELIRDEGIRSHFLNLPFVAVAVGLVVRGFAGYFLEQEGLLPPLSAGGVVVSPTQRLALFIVGGVVVSLLGVAIAADMGGDRLEDVIDAEEDDHGRET